MTKLSFIALSLAATSLACTSDKIVYRSGTSFPTPPSTAGSFIGYYDVTNKQTVCGSCHAEIAARWATTKHASAWADLQASGSAASYCEACHTTNALGNSSTDSTVGYMGAKDARYHDVQCESCHGPGLDHATSPTSVNRPLASISADTAIKNGCGECHSGTHEPFVTEWRLSGHSVTWATSHSSLDPECMGCHTAQGALTKWGITDNYREKNASTPNSVVCAVCHDPHGSATTAQLRFPLTSRNLDGNICMKCHQRRATPIEVTTRNSVHSPEGPTLLGTAGYFFPGMNASDSLSGTHGSSANPGLCATCHVSRYTVNDKATGKFVFQSTGHRFLATPCVDANGQPTVDQTCTIATQTFRSCVASGCHASENSARAAMSTAEARGTLLEGQLSALLAKVPASELKLGGTYTVALAAQFNLSVAQKQGAWEHNPYLVEQLLIASINNVKSRYNLTVSSSVDLTPIFRTPVRTSVGSIGR